MIVPVAASQTRTVSSLHECPTVPRGAVGPAKPAGSQSRIYSTPTNTPTMRGSLVRPVASVIVST